MTGAQSVEGSDDLLPVRMLNEFAYCPRLFHLMHVDGRWADNAYTVEGRAVHRRVDRFSDPLPEPGDDENEAAGDEPPEVARSVDLASHRLGLVAKLDLVWTAGDEAVPVDTKRGRVPDNPQRSWEPERVQLMAQGLLLRQHGFRTDHGVLYFAGSRTRVAVNFSAELEARTLYLIEEARSAAHENIMPPPLDDSPKCNGCSLSGICLPDESLALREVPPDPTTPGAEGGRPVRRLYPARETATPLYVQKQGARVGKRAEVLTVKKRQETLGEARLKDVSQLVLCGNVQISAQAIHLLCEAEVPIVHLSRGHWFYGVTRGISLRNAYDRAAQFRMAGDPEASLRIAREMIRAKSTNQRTMLRRNARPRPTQTLARMKRALRDIDEVPSSGELLGVEGRVASLYFGRFGRMLRSPQLDTDWDFEGRNRRPPRDPINALLSFGYAMLTKECTVALLAEGLDPWWGFYHRPRHGRPSLSLDLMEEFRPLTVDSAVLTAVNTGMVSDADFVRGTGGCALTESGRKAFIRAYESRMDQLVSHPVFEYRCSWRSMIRIQARLVSRWLRSDIPSYIGVTTR